MRRLVRILRWLVGAIALGLAGWWSLELVRSRPVYGADPDTGLFLRIAPLTPAERAAALEREAEVADGGIRA